MKNVSQVGAEREVAFYRLGPVWADPPRLCEATLEPGVVTYSALLFLMNRIEQRKSDAAHVRVILAACYGELAGPLTMGSILQLAEESKTAALTVIAWVSKAGGLRPDDFNDSGAKFLRLVLRKNPKSIAKIQCQVAA